MSRSTPRSPKPSGNSGREDSSCWLILLSFPLPRLLYTPVFLIHQRLRLLVFALGNETQNTFRAQHHTRINALMPPYFRKTIQTQMVARLNWHSMKKTELAHVKALNEAAIVSAQNSGDRTLVGAALGHLAHLYLREEQDTRNAYQLLDRAREHVQKHHALSGWFDIVAAAIAAKEGNQQYCEAAIDEAVGASHHMPQTLEYTDPYFTDFSMISVTAFAGNCWLSIEEPKKAYGLLTTMKMEELAVNRQASALYDISRAYFAAGQREEAQVYALRSIDMALTTKRLYIIPRFITLAQNILLTDHKESHAAAILEYAQLALQAE
jgi:hypothetical protein